jgi:DNA-binding MarR family transcriptional regulator
MNDIDEFIDLIFVINRLTKEGLENEKGSPSYIQLQALSFISNQKNPIIKSVAEHLNITPPSATFLINNLIKLELVNRLHNTQDKRMVHLVISKKGKKELAKSFLKSKKHLYKKLSLLSARERKNFILILKKISLLLTTKKNEH